MPQGRRLTEHLPQILCDMLAKKIKKKRNKRKRKGHMNFTPRSGASFAYVVRISTQASWWKRINLSSVHFMATSYSWAHGLPSMPWRLIYLGRWELTCTSLLPAEGTAHSLTRIFLSSLPHSAHPKTT